MYTNLIFSENARQDNVQNMTVAKAQQMLEVIASTPAAQLPPDIELNSISVGEMSDLCTIQSSNLSDFQQEVQKEEDSQRHQSLEGAHQQRDYVGSNDGIGKDHHHQRHHHHHHHHHQQQHNSQHRSSINEPGGRLDPNQEAEPVNYYYEPLNPYRMQKAERAPHMEEARLDIRMQKLYESLKAFDDSPPQLPPPPPPATNDPRTRYAQLHPTGVAASSRNYEDYSSSRYSGSDSRNYDGIQSRNRDSESNIGYGGYDRSNLQSPYG